LGTERTQSSFFRQKPPFASPLEGAGQQTVIARGQSNRPGNGANPLQLLPASNPRSLARLKKGRSDAHHRNGQGKIILAYFQEY